MDRLKTSIAKDMIKNRIEDKIEDSLGLGSNQNFSGGVDQFGRSSEQRHGEDSTWNQNRRDDIGGDQNRGDDFARDQNRGDGFGRDQNRRDDIGGDQDRRDDFGRDQNRRDDFGGGDQSRKEDFGGDQSRRDDVGDQTRNEFGDQNRRDDLGGRNTDRESDSSRSELGGLGGGRQTGDQPSGRFAQVQQAGSMLQDAAKYESYVHSNPEVSAFEKKAFGTDDSQQVQDRLRNFGGSVQNAGKQAESKFGKFF